MIIRVRLQRWDTNANKDKRLLLLSGHHYELEGKVDNALTRVGRCFHQRATKHEESSVEIKIKHSRG